MSIDRMRATGATAERRSPARASGDGEFVFTRQRLRTGEGDEMAEGARLGDLAPTATEDRSGQLAPVPRSRDGAATQTGADVFGQPHRRSPPLRRILTFVDLTMVAASWLAALSVVLVVGEVVFGPLTAIAQTLLLLAGSSMVITSAGLYRRSVCAVRAQEVARIGRASMVIGAAIVVLLAGTGRDAAILAGVVGGTVMFTLLVLERGVFREWIQARRASGDFGAPVIVVGGAAESTRDTAAFLDDNPVLGFDVRGIVSPEPEHFDGLQVRWLGRLDELQRHVAHAQASGVVLDASTMTGNELSEVMRSLSGSGLHVHVASGLRGISRSRISVAPLADETFLHVAPIGLTRGQFVVKRVIDVVVGAVALMVLAPVLIVAAVVIKLYDPGTVLFKQERVGLNGELFTLYKLRTMVADAELKRHELEAQNARSGPLFKVASDPRITPFGRFLRASSLDEAPQLFNVLNGTMSLVGPRPALPEEVAQFDDELNERLSVKPGVTGLWQVEARDLPSFDLYRRYDLLYVQNWSVGLDLAVIARTAAVVALRALGAILPSHRRRMGEALD